MDTVFWFTRLKTGWDIILRQLCLRFPINSENTPEETHETTIILDQYLFKERKLVLYGHYGQPYAKFPSNMRLYRNICRIFPSGETAEGTGRSNASIDRPVRSNKTVAGGSFHKISEGRPAEGGIRHSNRFNRITQLRIVFAASLKFSMN